MTDSNGIPSTENLNSDSRSSEGSDLNESRWEIPALDGIDFHTSPSATIENTQSLAQLSEATSTTMRAISEHSERSRPNQHNQQNAHDTSTAATDTSEPDPESTAAFDPLADDADLLPAGGIQPADQMPTIAITSPSSESETATAPLAAVPASFPASAAPAASDAPTTVASPIEVGTQTELADSLSVFAEDELEKTQIITNPMSGRHAHVAESSSHKDADRNTKRILIWGISGVLVLVLIVVLAVFFRNSATAHTHEEVLSSCLASRKAAEDSSKKLQEVIQKNESVANTQSSDVDDTATLTRVKNAVSQAKASIDNFNELDKCEDSLPDAQLTKIGAQADDVVTKQNDYTNKITKAAAAVEKSKSTKSVSNAKNDLSTKRQEAQSLYDSSADKVTDENTRTNLKKAIEAADALISQNSKNVTKQQYSSAVETLNNTMTAVQNSMKAYEQAEEAKRKEAESRAQGVCGNFAGTYSDGSTQFTLNGDCSITYADHSQGSPSSCTFEDGSTGACAHVDDQDNPSRITWSMQCSSAGACQNANVVLSGNGESASMNVGGRTYSKQ